MLLTVIVRHPLISLPVSKKGDLDSPLSPYFKRAKYQLVYNTLTESWHINTQARFARKFCQTPDSHLITENVSAVLVKNIGRNLYLNMIAQGISVWITSAQSAGEAIRAWQNGELLPLHEHQLNIHKNHCPFSN